MTSTEERSLYRSLEKHLTTQQQYKEHGFPPHPGKHVRDVPDQTCYRCGVHCSPVLGEERCVHHQCDAFIVLVPAVYVGLVVGKKGATVKQIKAQSGVRRIQVPTKGEGSGKFKEIRILGGLEAVTKAEKLIKASLRLEVKLEAGQWKCCGGKVESDGCMSSASHVIYTDFQDQSMLVNTVTRRRETTGSWKVLALDCEMVVTRRGFEVARVTLLDWSGNTVYDSLVLPQVTIGDYMTQYSGITESLLQGVTTSLAKVQEDIIELVSAEDILIGHSLNSDLWAVHLVHEKIVDTSLVFPHKEGKHIKNSLKYLADQHLGRKIQNEDHGHDSKEDALACLDLMKTNVML